MKHEVLIISEPTPLAARIERTLCEALGWGVIVGSPSSPATWSAHGGKVSAVVLGDIGSRPSVIRSVVGAVVEFAQAARLRLVYLGSMSAYGAATGRVDESTPLLGGLNAYATARAAAEEMVRSWPDSVILRIGVEYGPGVERWSRQIAELLASRRLGDLGACGDGTCNLVYVDDIAAAVGSSLGFQGDTPAVFNLAGDEKVTWNEYFLRFALQTGAVPVRRIGARRLRWESRVPAVARRILDILLGRRMDRYLGAWGWITPSLLVACSHEIELDSHKAKDALQLDWTPLDTGLARTAEWLRASGSRASDA